MMRINFTAMCLFTVAVATDLPSVPSQWQADAILDSEGNSPHITPGKTPFHFYYDYPNRHRY